MALAEAQMGLAILEHDFKRLAPGVDLPCLGEVNAGVGGEQAVPLVVLVTAHEEDSDLYPCQDGVIRDILALEPEVAFQKFKFYAESD